MLIYTKMPYTLNMITKDAYLLNGIEVKKEYTSICLTARNINSLKEVYLRNDFDFRSWNFMYTLQETRSIHDSTNLAKNEFIAFFHFILNN